MKQFIFNLQVFKTIITDECSNIQQIFNKSVDKPVWSYILNQVIEKKK